MPIETNGYSWGKVEGYILDIWDDSNLEVGMQLTFGRADFLK